MSFAVSGLTHCVDCWSSLSMNEHYRCTSCQEKYDKEQAEREERRKQKALKAEIVEEVRSTLKDDLAEELAKTRFETPIQTITVDTNKPLGYTFDDWYSKIGYEVIQMYQKGNKEILINFEEGDINENKTNGRLEGSNEE